MNKQYDDFIEIYETAMGLLVKEYRVAWVGEDISLPGTPYSQAYEDLWTARESLSERFGMDFEDDDLELIMNAILTIERSVGYRLFCCGIAYAQRGCKI